jgi:hypothetical protein
VVIEAVLHVERLSLLIVDPQFLEIDATGLFRCAQEVGALERVDAVEQESL